MLISVCGAQGSGKSTILSELRSLGHNVIERKTSRSILDDWGVTLQQVNADRDLTLKFQDEIIKRKYEDELAAVQSNEMWFTERTYADLFTYALINLGKDNDNSDWLDNYFETCKKYQQSYSKVFYLKSGMFNVVYDGVRGANQHYSNMVDLVMWDYTNQLSSIFSSAALTKVYKITVPDVDERVEFILDKVYNHV